MKDRRLQVLLEQEQYRALEGAAAERGVSVATVVREAIGSYLGTDPHERAAAGRRLLDADPMPVGSPGELREELDALRGRRA
jgi:hypothetical protein